MSEIIIGCPVDDALAKRVEATIAQLKDDPSNASRSDVVDLIVELADASFNYHFVRPLKDLNVGFATRKGIEVGLKGAVRVIRSSLQKVIKSLDDANFAKVAGYLEDARRGETG